MKSVLVSIRRALRNITTVPGAPLAPGARPRKRVRGPEIGNLRPLHDRTRRFGVRGAPPAFEEVDGLFFVDDRHESPFLDREAPSRPLLEESQQDLVFLALTNLTIPKDDCVSLLVAQNECRALFV